MNTKFLRAVKSTIDKLVVDFAQAQSTPTNFLDLDDVTAAEEVLASTDPAVIWELGSFEEYPQDPLYALSFSVGVRTFQDAANYSLLSMASDLSELFQSNTYFEITDSSDTVESAKKGTLIITSFTLNQQTYDKTSGVRLGTVVARATRWLS